MNHSGDKKVITHIQNCDKCTIERYDSSCLWCWACERDINQDEIRYQLRCLNYQSGGSFIICKDCIKDVEGLLEKRVAWDNLLARATKVYERSEIKEHKYYKRDYKCVMCNEDIPHGIKSFTMHDPKFKRFYKICRKCMQKIERKYINTQTDIESYKKVIKDFKEKINVR